MVWLGETGIVGYWWWYGVVERCGNVVLCGVMERWCGVKREVVMLWCVIGLGCGMVWCGGSGCVVRQEYIVMCGGPGEYSVVWSR